MPKPTPGQVSIWEAIDEAEGITMCDSDEIRAVLESLTPDQPEARFHAGEWDALMVARRKASKATGRTFITARQPDQSVLVTLTPLTLPVADLRAGDVIWPGGVIVESVHRRERRTRLVTRQTGGTEPVVGLWMASAVPVAVYSRGPKR